MRWGDLCRSPLAKLHSPVIEITKALRGPRCLECVRSTERKKEELGQGEEQRDRRQSSYGSKVMLCHEHPSNSHKTLERWSPAECNAPNVLPSVILQRRKLKPNKGHLLIYQTFLKS